MITAYLLSAFSYLAGIGLNVTGAWLITMASFMPPVLTLSVAVVMVRFFGIGRAVTRYLERIISHKSVFNKLAKLRSDLYRRIASNPEQILNTGTGGQLIKQVVDDVERAQEYELRVLLPGAAAIITTFGAAGLAFWLQPQMGLAWLIISIAATLLAPMVIQRALASPTRKLEELESKYSDAIRSSVHGALEAEIYGYVDEVIARAHKVENQIFDLEREILRIIRGFQLLINFIITSLLIWTFFFASRYSLPPVQITMFVFLALTGFESILNWYPNLYTSGKLKLAQSKLANIPEVKPEKKLDVEFDQLVANSYSPFWSNQIIKPLEFKLKRGEVLVLRGPSGIGKSTSAMGILNLTQYVGSLTINGVEIRKINNLPKLVAGALQNGHIFNTSLRENLRISGSDNLQEVLTLLELETLVSELPEGLDTIIGDFGRPISGGEAKRIVLARALLSDAPLLVLDEPTEHLDPDLAERIASRILEKYRDRALLVITHSGWCGVPQLEIERFLNNH